MDVTFLNIERSNGVSKLSTCMLLWLRLLTDRMAQEQSLGKVLRTFPAQWRVEVVGR